MATKSKFPVLTPYEEDIFHRFFVAKYTPRYHFMAVQLEGNKRLPVVAAGLRMIKKGVVTNWQSCHWGLTEIGRKMADKRWRAARKILCLKKQR